MLILSQPIEEIQDPFVKRLRMLIKEYDMLLGDTSMLNKNIREYYKNYIEELEAKLRQIITYKLIFEYAKTNSSDKELLLAYHELEKIKNN